jgi:hypothetical protein
VSWNLKDRRVNLQWNSIFPLLHERTLQVFYSSFRDPPFSDNGAKLFAEKGESAWAISLKIRQLPSLICGCSNIGCQTDSHAVGKFLVLCYIIHFSILLSITTKMQRHIIFFINVNILHVSGGSVILPHHTLYASNLLYYIITAGHIPVAVCTVLSSWWWAENPPETCRALTVIKNIV